jgi:RNA polymerase sigma factor (sigma-70 family)
MDNFVKMKIAEKYTDQEVIEKVLKGETGLFEILIRRNNPFLYKTGRAYGYNHEDTEDLMQDTFIKAYTSLNKFEHRSSFKTWLIRIMLNNCFHKRQKFSFKNEQLATVDIHENSKPMYAENNHSDTNRNLINKELNHVIENSVTQLPMDYRTVFMLREMNGLNLSETAEALGISEANVKVRLHRAKSLLRKEIEKTYSPTDLYEFNLVYCDRIVEKVMAEIKKLM